MSIRHDDLWRAIDVLAAENGMTASGLARAAGLDATTFNRSKRRGTDGRPRWPSTESLSRALDATGVTLEAFTSLVAGAPGLDQAPPEPTLQMTRLEGDRSAAIFARDGSLADGAWESRQAPSFADPGAYALRIDTVAHEPAVRRGDLVMVSPEAQIERGDRVLACVGGDLCLALLLHHSPLGIAIERLGCGTLRDVPARDVDWMHRVSWIGR